jgi:hypothetical protein
LNEAQADSPEIREALKFMTQYRLGDNSLPVVTLRDMARQMMASRQLNDSADTSNNNGS